MLQISVKNKPFRQLVRQCSYQKLVDFSKNVYIFNTACIYSCFQPAVFLLITRIFAITVSTALFYCLKSAYSLP